MDLTKLPVPLWHTSDGGKYIGTWCICITKDPESDWVNWGTYRLMLQTRNSTGVQITPYQHIGRHFAAYQKRGEDMPMAVAIGAEPVCGICGGSAFPFKVNEVEMAGALREKPVELVKCETSDLRVPASSEVILEGKVSIHDVLPEGEFGEYSGYYGGLAAPRPVFHVEAVTFRNDPILTGVCEGKPVIDDHVLTSIDRSVLATQFLKKTVGLPVRMVYFPPVPSHICFVSLESAYAGIDKIAAAAIMASAPGRNTNFIFTFDADVDVTDPMEVFWALTTRCHPARGIHVTPETPASPLVPSGEPEERQVAKGAVAHLNAMFPFDWPKSWRAKVVDFEDWPAEIRSKVIKRLSPLGLNS